MSYVPSSLGRSAIKPSTDEINRQKQLKAWLASDLNHEDEVQYDHLDVSGPTNFLLKAILDFKNPSKPLPDRLPFIRLATLMPGKDFDQIEVSMSITERPYATYEALSYCWGDAAALSPILCDGHRLYVTQNLKCALRDLRHPDTERTLWIDAICINQKDLKERAEQVSAMKDIYRDAQRTVVWLGDKFPGIELAFQLVNRMYDLYFDKLEGDAFDSFVEGRWRPAKDHTSPTKLELNSLDFLLSQPWFRRVWVIQEFCLGEEVSIVSGDQETGWMQFVWGSLIALHWVQKRPVFSPVMRSLLQLSNLRFAVSNLSDGTRLDLLYLCSRFRHYLSTDPRDKIFGLVGLTDSDLESLNFIPSYSSSPEEVYIRLAESMLKSSDTLNILSIPRGATKLSLPSWVPDWSDHLAAEPFWEAPDKGEECPYKATNKSTSPPPLFGENNSLTLYGHRIDRLSTLTASFSEHDLDNSQLHEKKNALLAFSREGSSWKSPIEYLRRTLKAYCLTWEFLKWIQERVTLIAMSYDTMSQWNEMTLGPGNRKTTDIYTPTGEPLEMAYMATLQVSIDPVPEPVEEGFRIWWRSCRPTTLLRKAKLHKIPGLYLRVVTVMFLIRVMLGWEKRGDFTSLSQELVNKQLFRTAGEYLGLVSRGAMVDDEVWLLKGGNLPFLLRKAGGEKYELIGECYVHGVMSGEKFEGERCREVTII
jgi:hypothetical protein